MTFIRRMGLLLVVALVTMAATASAQTPPPQASGDVNPPQVVPGRGQRPGGAANPVVTMNTVQDMIDGWALRRAQRDLALSASQYQAFVVKMTMLQSVRREHQHQRNRLIMAINQTTRPGATADEATIAAGIKALDDLETRMISDERAALAGVDAVLTTFQRARFRVFEENNEKEKVRLIATVMAEPGRGPSPVPPAKEKKGGGR